MPNDKLSSFHINYAINIIECAPIIFKKHLLLFIVGIIFCLNLHSQEFNSSTKKDLSYIAGKINYGMNPYDANIIMDSDFVTINIGGLILNEFELMSYEDKVVGIAYKSKLARFIIKNEISNQTTFESSPASDQIIEDAESIKNALTDKDYIIVYNSASTRLNPFRHEPLFILRKGTKVVGFIALGIQDWILIISTNDILANPAAFKKVFDIPISQVTSDMQDIF